MDSRACPFIFHDSKVMFGNVTSCEIPLEWVKEFHKNRNRWIDQELRAPRCQLVLTPGGNPDKAIIIPDSRLFPRGENPEISLRKSGVPFLHVTRNNMRGTQSYPIEVIYVQINLMNWDRWVGALRSRHLSSVGGSTSGDPSDCFSCQYDSTGLRGGHLPICPSSSS